MKHLKEIIINAVISLTRLSFFSKYYKQIILIFLIKLIELIIYKIHNMNMTKKLKIAI